MVWETLALLGVAPDISQLRVNCWPTYTDRGLVPFANNEGVLVQALDIGGGGGSLAGGGGGGGAGLLIM